jgi:acetyl esterase/lipase
MATSQPSSEPVLAPEHSLLTNISNNVKMRLVQFVANRTVPQAKEFPPTSIKTYPSLPHLKSRLFMPLSYKEGDVLPLYLNIHGGGFALMEPAIDDKFCWKLCNDNKILVVSLDYPKAPQNPYPAAVNQVIELVGHVLEDKELPIDHSKVAVGGFSAGGNLSIAISQDPSLRLKIGGIIAVYPPTNWSTPMSESLASRPKDAPPDMLKHIAPMFDWGYIKPGQDLMDPRLSVFYAKKEDLPKKIYVIGCEWDMLCRDAEKFAGKIAGRDWKGTETEWEMNDVKWEKILGMEHGMSSPLRC